MRNLERFVVITYLYVDRAIVIIFIGGFVEQDERLLDVFDVVWSFVLLVEFTRDVF